jgi:hypothetical protein
VPADVRPARALAAAIAAATALTLLLAAPAPSYDPWAWLLWGREIAHGALSTTDGPAFKPLPVAVTTVLAPLGGAAPWLWVLIARAGAIAALVLAFRLGGILAAAAVLATGEFAGLSAAGMSEGLLLALALGGVESWRSGRPRLAFACAVACGLIRVEAWPFLLAAAWFAWRRRPQDRPLLLAAAIAIPAAWLLPELIGSGDLFRAGARARIPNPGQPALAGFPFWASLRDALALPPWPVWPGLAAAALLGRRALLPAAAGAAWILVVALMCQLGGFSGEARYALPGAALIAISGATGLALAIRWAVKGASQATNTAQRWRRPAQALGFTLLLAALLVPEAQRIADIRPTQAHQWRLYRDLTVAARTTDLCGTPYTGPLRGPLTAYVLHLKKSEVEPDDPPHAPGVVFRSSLNPGDTAEPDAPADFAKVAQTGLWTVSRRCR